MLAVNGLTKRYAGRAAIEGLTFQVPAGQAVGFLGPNGAGKTTTMRLLTGFLSPDEGRAEVAGIDVGVDALQARRRLGYLPEDNPLAEELEVTEAVHEAAVLRGMLDGGARLSAVKQALRRCGLKPAIGKRVWELSKGYRQRLGLARAIVHDPDVLLLDEPTSGLDPNQIDEVRGLIGELKARKTLLISTHILAEASASCDRLLILHAGRIAADGSPAQLATAARAGRRLRVELKAQAEQARLALAALPGVSACLDLPQGGFALESPPETDLREAVFSLAVERRWPILALVEERPGLEEVFRSLTQP